MFTLRSIPSLSRTFHTFKPFHKQNVMESLDVLSGVNPPLNNIQSILPNGFIFSEGISVQDKSCLLIANRILEFKPDYKIINGFIVEFTPNSLGFLKLINPLPDLFIIGLGSKSRLLSETNTRFFNELGIKLEISDSKAGVRNFNLLATERPNQIGGIFLPPNV
ncbi:hypothetical protein BN7_4208 [Wickerhamomyces ciferrii]|uniref:NADH dehydrogenase [ubiquinone] 1 alpha subcomplex assembly factor 3 n=1 Tax=Wickerhamomyces ciferrii (strain ATCC 14091 / BCRC 22168 / CBS 111 / JCM 3599 / NBRC 0793 / NRRL Y-1031 F-60-10) TaxID=1206466 RepID=K0KTD5_WICCF|nr:uncharacterized protein BN7_4208 [Wickerhamomyces ciferrii]CCH44639.1 hypothetical protein BN7_4208 [Wickerhamomyces ciferrii]